MTHFAVETVAILPQGDNGFRHVFIACAGKASAEWQVERYERPKGFDARVVEVTEEEHAAILRGEWNGWLPTSRLP